MCADPRVRVLGAFVLSLSLFCVQQSLAQTTSRAINRAPIIAGVPPTSIEVNRYYTFRPWSRDYEGDALRFSIANKPAWANFDAAAGRLTGRPRHVGRWTNIRISVTDGRHSVALRPFSLDVMPPPRRAAVLSWLPALTDINGSALYDVAGYTIHYGVDPNVLHETILISNPGLTTYVIDGLAPADYYFAIRAISAGGSRGPLSNIVAQTIQ